METQVKVDLTDFRLETRKWLEENCPISMRGPVTDAKQLYWGGRNGKFNSEDQKVWFERMLEKNGLFLTGKQNMVEVDLALFKTTF